MVVQLELDDHDDNTYHIEYDTGDQSNTSACPLKNSGHYQTLPQQEDIHLMRCALTIVWYYSIRLILQLV